MLDLFLINLVSMYLSLVLERLEAYKSQHGLNQLLILGTKSSKLLCQIESEKLKVLHYNIILFIIQ